MGGLFGRPASPQTNATAIGSLNVQTSAYGTPIPWVFGTARVSPNLLQYADFKAIPHTSSQSAGGKGGGDVTTTNYTYTAAVILGLTHGPVAGITRAWKDKDLASVASLQLDVYNGSSAQAPHPYFATKHADQALAYRGVSYVASGAYDLGSSATLGNHSFEVQSQTTIPGKPDAKISDVIRAILTDTEQGLGLSAANLGDWTQFDNFCLANGIWVSPVYKEQKPAYEAIKRLLQIGFADCVRSNGVLKIIPYSDAAAVSPLAEYVPTIAPCADLTEDDFLTADSPVQIARKSQRETFNHVKVKYSDRTNDYNDSVAEAKDQADIEAFGLRSMSDVELKEICDPAVAQKVADFILQRSLSIRNEYEFQLAWKYCWLEPMDVVRLWYPRKGLSGQPVLITEIAEDEDGTLTVKAEDYPLGANRATLVPPTTTSGYTPDFSVDPGNATVPAILEAPLALTNGEPQLWLATAGGANWGGADVWISTDNISYQKVGRQTTKSRYGTLTAPLPAGAALDSLNTVAVDLTASGGVLQGGTQQNAQDLLTRSLIGGEFFAFANANLVSLGKYNLSYLVRGAYGSDIVDHAAGETFVRLDDGLFAYAYPKEWMGKTVWVKLVSVNVYGGGAQDLSSVPAYTYTIQGAPVGAVQNLRITSAWTAGTDVKVAWDLVPDAASYDVEIWAGAVPQRVRSLNVKGNEFAYDPQDQRADGGPWRSVTVKVRSRALTGRTGRWASVSALNPQIGALQALSVDSGIRAGYVRVQPPADSDFAGIVVWCSTDAACMPVDANKVYDGIGTVVTINKLGNGAALVGGMQYYVRAAAYDSFGKDSLIVSTAVSFTAAGVIPEAGSVAASQLTADLSRRVDLIDAPVSVAGSVAQRIADEAAARAGADNANAAQIAAEITARQGGDNKNAGDIAAEIVARQSGDNANAAQIAAEISARLTGDGKNASDIAAEIAQRQNGDTVLNSRVDVLSASFVGAGGENMYIGPDVLSVAPAVYGSSLVGLKDSSTLFGNPYGLKPGETLTLSADLWLDAASVAAGESLVLWIWAHNAAGQWANAAFVSHASTVAVRKSAQLTLPADEAAMSGVFLALYHVKAQSNVPADAGTAFAGRIQVERGTVATAYKAGQQRASAALSQEQKARADADLALGYRIDTVKAQADGNAAAITQEAGVRASAVGALSSRIDTVKAQADGNAASVTQEQKARSDGDSALAARVDVVTASANNAIAAINDEKTVRAGADGALSARIDAVKVTADGNAAAITQESAARVGGDNALSARLDILTASTNNAISAISAEQIARANGDASLASQITTVAANFAAAGGENMYIGPEPMTVAPGAYGSVAIFIKDAAQNPYGLQPGETLTISADLWLDAPSAAAAEYAQIYLWAQNASGGWTASAAMICTSSSVARKTASLVLPAESQMVAIGIALYHVTSAGNVAGQAGTAYAGRIQIERGGVATAYKAGQQRLGAALTQEQKARADADLALGYRIDTVKAQADGNAAAITQEAGVRASAVGALSSRIDTVKAQADGNAASLTQEQKARSDGDTALAARVDVVTASANNAIAAINDEKTVRADADGALSARIDTVKAQADGNDAAITQEAGVRASAVGALSSRIDAVKAQADGNAASLTQEQKARSDGDSALAARVDVVTASANNAIAAINDEKTVRAGADGALSARIDAVKVTADGNAAAITQESAARVGGDNALSARLDILTASTNNAISAISAEQIARANGDASLASQITTVAANFAAAGGENMYIGPDVLSVAPGAYGSQSVMIRDLANNPYALQPGEYLTISADIWLDSASAANGEFAQLYLWTQNASGGWTGATVVRGSTTTPTRVSASVLLPGPDSALSGIYVGLYHFTSAGGAVGQVGTAYAGRIQVERGGVATAYKAGQQRLSAAVQTESIARANAVSALSSQITVVQTTVNGHTASIQQQATSISGLESQYTLKVTADNAIAGIGLAASSANGQPTSDVTILADRFALVQPGVAKRVPFVVTSKNGVPQIGFDGSIVVSGSMTGDVFAFNSLTGDRIASDQLTTRHFTSGSVTTQVLAADSVQAVNIAARAVTVEKMNVDYLSAISARIGVFRTATSGGRTEIADNVIKVFDENGTLRVKIGNLAL